MTSFASKDLTVGELNALVREAGGEDKVRRILSGEFKIQFLSTTAKGVVVQEPSNQFMTIRPNLVFGDRIKRGKYDWVNSNLMEEKFPVTADQVGEWEWKLFRFRRRRKIFSGDAILLVEKDGFEPAQIGHILTFGEINPEEQRKYPIIGLGSVAKVYLDRSVPVLWADCDGRGLGLGWFDHSWHSNYRFLGVRRRSVA